MNTQKDRLWLAYLDGELATSEAAEFDQSLRPEEKDRLQAEIRFECALGEVLGQGGACPEEVWQRTSQAVMSVGGKRVRRRLPAWQYGAVAMAAVVMLTVAGVVYQAYFMGPSFLDIKARSIHDFVAQAEIKASEAATVNDYLHNHGIALSVRSLEDAPDLRHHAQALLGATEQTYRGEPVAELLYECCGRPVKVVIAPKNSEAATAIRKAIDENKVQDFRSVGDYVAAIVGHHHAPGLIDLLSEDPANPSGRA